MKLTVLVFSNPDTSPKACMRPAYGPESVAIPRSMPSSKRRPMFNSVLESACAARRESACGYAFRFWAAAASGLAVLGIALPLLAVPTRSLAAEPSRCLGGDEQRAAIVNSKTVPIATVIHSLHRAPKEVIKAQLCQEPDRLVYKLTLLGRDGKVKRETVDATNGAVVGER
jgi:hypothetical protein